MSRPAFSSQEKTNKGHYKSWTMKDSFQMSEENIRTEFQHSLSQRLFVRSDKQDERHSAVLLGNPTMQRWNEGSVAYRGRCYRETVSLKLRQHSETHYIHTRKVDSVYVSEF